MTSTRLPKLRPVAAAAAAVAVTTGAVAADAPSDPNPYYIGLSQSVTHDSNVQRLSGGGPADTFFTTGVVGGFDQSIGRQHFSGTGNIGYNQYRRDSSLNNVSYGVSAGWQWSTIERLSGGLNVSASQSLATNTGNSPVPTTDRNVLNTDQVSASLQYGGYGRFSLGADYAHSRVKYSAPAYFASESSGDSLGGNLSYIVSPDINFGIGYRVTRSNSPYGLLISPGVYESAGSNGRNIDLSSTYRVSALTGISGRVSFTRQSSSSASDQGFSGITGALNGNYQATGKIGLTIGFSRDAGTNGAFFNVPVTQNGTTTVANLGLYQYSTVSNSLSLGASYAATSKVGANLGYTYREAKLANSSTFAGVSTTADSRDTLRIASVGVSYSALRWLGLGCSLSHESRSVDTVPTITYGANVVSCSATATLR